MPMPDGVLAMVIDDGKTILHCFAELAPWRDVAVAMGACADAYAEATWVRVDCPGNAANPCSCCWMSPP
jgi:hypothetical protein